MEVEENEMLPSWDTVIDYRGTPAHTNVYRKSTHTGKYIFSYDSNHKINTAEMKGKIVIPYISKD